MPASKKEDAELGDLKAVERSIVMSFLTLSERQIDEDTCPMDELALSLALKASAKGETPS